MKRIALILLLLLIALPVQVAAFGSFSTDQLNTTNTEQNITFGLRAETAQESYTEINQHTEEPLYGIGWVAQTFTVGNRGTNSAFSITNVEIRGYREGSVAALNVSIRDVNGTGYPTGADLCFGSIDPSTVGTSPELINISITGCDLAPSTQYAIILRATGTVLNWIRYFVDKEISTYTGGEWFISADSGSSWGILYSGDISFTVYGRSTLFSEIVWVSIPRNVNIVNGMFDMRGFNTTDFITEDIVHLQNSTATSGAGYTNDTNNVYDNDWDTFAKMVCGSCSSSLFMNFTITGGSFSTAIVSYKVGDQGIVNTTIPDTCIWKNGDIETVIINAEIMGVTNPGANETSMECFLQDSTFLTINTSNCPACAHLYEVDIFYNETTFPENVTVDIGNDGDLDFINRTVFSSSETFIFNSSGLEDLNTNLHDICEEDWTTGICDVPFNISSDTHGVLEISDISITGEFITGIYNVSVFDELTELPFDISIADSVILRFFCDNETQNVTLTQQGQNVTVLCEINEVQIEITELGEEVVRYLIPDSAFDDLNFFVYNSTEETDVAQEWIVYDVIGEYPNGIVEVTKVLPSGEQTMIEKIIDAEGKVTLYLIVGERYCISVFTATKTNERSVGCIDADADATKRLSISDIPFSQDQDLIFQDVFITFSWDKDLEIIQGTYNDTLDETTSVTFNVYNVSNISQIVFTDTSTAAVVTFTFNNVDVNQSYIAEITAVHQRYGVIDPQMPIAFEGLFRVGALVGPGYGIWMSIAGAMIFILTMLSFGKKHVTIGLTFSLFILLLLMFWGWFDESPQLTWSLLTLVAFMIFGYAMAFRRRK